MPEGHGKVFDWHQDSGYTPTEPLENDHGAVPVEMRAGHVAIFSSLLLHRSGPNTSRDRPRRGYVPQYHVPNPILLSTGQPFGDQVPVLRNGEPHHADIPVNK